MSFVGLPRYEDLTVGAKGCIAKAGLTSFADMDLLAGVVTAAVAGGESANIAYSSNGVKLPYDARITLTVNNAAIQTALRYNCIVGFEIDSDWINGISMDASYDQYAIHSLNSGSQVFEVKKGANSTGNAENSYVNARFGSPNTGLAKCRGATGSRARVVLVKTGAALRMYVDDFLVAENIAANTDMASTNNTGTLYIGGRNSTNRSPKDHSISNYFLIYGQNVIFPVLPKMRRINIYGDSKACLGNYDSDAATDYQVILSSATASLDGLVDADYVGNALYHDAKFTPQMHRLLNQRNLFPGGGRIFVWGCGGSGVVLLSSVSNQTLGTRVTASLSNYPVPSVAIIDIGINDCRSSSTAVDAAWDAAYRAAIQDLIDANSAVQIVVMNVHGCTDYNGLTQAQVEAKIDAANTYIDAYPVDFPQVKKVNAFAAFGGHSPSATYLVDGVHRTPVADTILARLVDAAIV